MPTAVSDIINYIPRRAAMPDKLADMRPITRLRSGLPWRPQPGLLIAGIILGWLLHSAFQHLTQIQTTIP
jgi:hypothetical protein